MWFFSSSTGVFDDITGKVVLIAGAIDRRHLYTHGF